ncbi:hypothetical protein KI387_035649 [Taxus chinensis]|uniref:AP-5 complex subunit beta-1 n=1 Tax=Taxus chinensis TaxID=29808 RepID=A0AA38FRT4_TAXCH|nr:hypothetical protein KI387_035649 [Taxus chinensis]
MEKVGKQLSGQDWELMIDAFQSGSQQKWLSQYPGLAILELALYTVVKKDYNFPLKSQLITFVEENAGVLIADGDADEGLGSVVEALKAIVQGPADGVMVTYALKEQIMVAATSVMIVADSLHRATHHLEALVELLVGVINRPNHGVDRQARAIACECLRQLEKAYPCLLYAYAGHLLLLCQSERTHAAQGYILLLTMVIHNLACHMYNSSARVSGLATSILSTSVPWVPFNVPPFLAASAPGEERTSIPCRELAPINRKEFHRVVAFFLERPQILTACGMLEFVSDLINVAVALELQASLLKVQFSGLIYSYNPILCHIVLMVYTHFVDAFDGEEKNIFRRLLLISKEASQPLFPRLLAIHWMLGLENLLLKKNGRSMLVSMASGLYPPVFDPLSLKAIKLDALAYCAINFDLSLKEGLHYPTSRPLELSVTEIGGHASVAVGEVTAGKLFNDGLACVSSFRWLPPWSTETRLAFRMLHRFLTVATPHPATDEESISLYTKSALFDTLQSLLVKAALELQKLVPNILSLIDRLLHCDSHRVLGECLLQIFNDHLLSKLVPDRRLSAYFPIFDRIAESSCIPPCSLLELLTLYSGTLVKNYDPETLSKSWSRGSKVLGICRTVLMHHHSSRVFLVLSRLLAFLCRFYPDLEIRDSARIYLRMLICIPGNKLRHILSLGDQLPDDSSAPQLSSFFRSPSPRAPRNVKQKLSAYIHLSRVTPLIVKQSWSLVIVNSDICEEIDSSSVVNMNLEEPSMAIGEPKEGTDIEGIPNDGVTRGPELLRVMDSKVSEMLGILRRHFAVVPDVRHGPGLKVNVHCKLSFDSEGMFPPGQNDSFRNPQLNSDDSWPALYAIVIKFSSSGQYGSIPSIHIPFLMGEPPRKNESHFSSKSEEEKLILVHVQDGSARGEGADRKIRADNNEKNKWSRNMDEDKEPFQESVMIELEPKEPVPALIDALIEASGEAGQSIRGQLQSIPVGIEDLFMKSPVPSDVQEDEIADYFFNLFNALWEACESPVKIGRETFLLRGSKGVTAIHGTGSVKLLETRSDRVIDAAEHFLAPFIVAVSGDQLVNIVKDNSIVKDVVWKDEKSHFSDEEISNSPGHSLGQEGPLQLKYLQDAPNVDDSLEISRRHIGCFFILIFLPPRFHLLLKMEVSDFSTLVRIRTDHWPCLAYVDEFLEALAIK